jgi:NADH-quinone oxidoreductase subunit J
MAAEMTAVLYGRWSGLLVPPRALPAGYSNTKELGRLIYTDYVLAFEIAAVVLLVAIIAAIALTLRQRKDTRSQDPVEQVRVRRADRVRLVSMAPTKDA